MDVEQAAAVAKSTRDAQRMKLREKLQRQQINRRAVPSRAHVERARQENERKWARADAAERKAAEQSEDDKDASDRNETMEQMHHRRTVLLRRAHALADTYRQWSWQEAKAVYEALTPRPPQFGLQFRFLVEDNDLIQKSYLSVLVIVERGHAWCIITDQLGGLQEMLDDQRGVLCLESTACIEHLERDPHYSRKMAKKRNGLVLNNLNLSAVPFYKPPYWPVNWLPSEFVSKNIHSRDAFHTAYPTADDRNQFIRGVLATKNAMATKIMAWREEAATAAARAASTVDAVGAVGST